MARDRIQPRGAVVLTVPQRLRPYFLYHRALLGDLSRVAARRITASRSLGSGAPGVRACRLVAPTVPDPGRAIGSRPLIGPRGRSTTI